MTNLHAGISSQLSILSNVAKYASLLQCLLKYLALTFIFFDIIDELSLKSVYNFAKAFTS